MAKVLVTGANRGIGLELCAQLAERGDEVIAVCRNPSPELEKLKVQIIAEVDVADDTSVKSLGDKLKGIKLDWLINNAGIFTLENLSDLNFERMRKQFEVNTLGPLRVTAALLPNLKNGSKVSIITSRVGSIADNKSGDYYGYRASKVAVNMVGVNLARDLKDKGISVFLLHPGLVATSMTDGQGIPPAEAASGIIERINELTIRDTGTFWHQNGEQLPW